jgi:hypothetical protein
MMAGNLNGSIMQMRHLLSQSGAQENGFIVNSLSSGYHKLTFKIIMYCKACLDQGCVTFVLPGSNLALLFDTVGTRIIQLQPSWILSTKDT